MTQSTILASVLYPVDDRRGAPMGRPSLGDVMDAPPGSVHLFRVRLNSGGYDSGGAYWGTGTPLYCAAAFYAGPDGEPERYQRFTRASTRDVAAVILGIPPNRLVSPVNRELARNYALATLDNRGPRWPGWSNAKACRVLGMYGAATGQVRESHTVTAQ